MVSILYDQELWTGMTLIVSWKPMQRVCSDSVREERRHTGQQCTRFGCIASTNTEMHLLETAVVILEEMLSATGKVELGHDVRQTVPSRLV